MLIENMKSMERMAAISDGAAIIIIILVLSLISSEGQDLPSEHEHNIFPPNEGFLDGYNPVSSIIFAYQGGSNTSVISLSNTPIVISRLTIALPPRFL